MLITIISKFIPDKVHLTTVQGFERLIALGLKDSSFYEKDDSFSFLIKLNLTIVLCRIIFMKIESLPSIPKMASQPVKLSPTIELELTNSIIDEITANKNINHQFLKKFNKLSLDEFQTNYQNLQNILITDKIYIENFRKYLRDLVKFVFNITHTRSKKFYLNKLDLVIVRDLAECNLKRNLFNGDKSYFYLDKKEKKESKKKELFEKPSSISSLSGYNYFRKQILQKHKDEKIYAKLLEYSKIVVEKYIKSKDITYSEPSIAKKLEKSDLSQWVGSKVDVIVRGQAWFASVEKKPHKYAYKYIVYLLECKLAPYLELPYIGFTGDLKKRLRGHISETLESNLNDKVTRYIERVILLSLRKEFTLIQAEIVRIDPRANINDLKAICGWLQSKLGTYHSKQLYTFLVEKVLKKHFQVIKLELHKNRQRALNSEKSKTHNFVHNSGGKKVIGTIWPNGLNMIAGGSGGKKLDYDLPVFDYLALVSLGFKHEEIIKALTQIYKKNFASSTFSTEISRVFSSYEELQEIVLKPVVEKLIKDSEDFLFRDIAASVRLDTTTLNSKLHKWFEGKRFIDLKALIKVGLLDWSKIQDYNIELIKTLKGYSKDEWTQWLITASRNITLKDIAKKAGFSIHYLTSKKFAKPLSRILIAEDIGKLGVLRKELRRKTTIELLKKGFDPKDLLENKFKIKYRSPSQLRLFFNTLFSDVGINFYDLINMYSNNPEHFLGKYR